MDTLQPKTEIETVNTLLVGAKDELTRLNIQKRYVARRVSSKREKRDEQTLATITGQMKDTTEYIEFLEDIQGELAGQEKMI